MQTSEILENVDTSYIDAILMDERGLIKPVPHSHLKDIPHIHLRIWCSKRAVYVIPTTELIDYLKSLMITAAMPVEICAGNGSIGRALGIPSTDSYMQTEPHMKMWYASLGQKPITPPPDVLKGEAIEIINSLKPDFVVGAFVTQKFKKGDEETQMPSSVYGVDEMQISRKVKQYIKIGNDNVHGRMRIMNLEHQTIRPEFLVTRAIDQSKNGIYIFNFTK